MDQDYLTSSGLTRDQLIVGNMWIVYTVMTNYYILPPELYNDCMSEGFVGLIKWVDKRNWNYQYGQWVNRVMMAVRSHIHNYLRDIGYIHTPHNLRYKLYSSITPLHPSIEYVSNVYNEILLDLTLEQMLDNDEYTYLQYRFLYKDYEIEKFGYNKYSRVKYMKSVTTKCREFLDDLKKIQKITLKKRDKNLLL